MVLTQKQHDFITLLINGETIVNITNRLGICRQTIYNWSSKPNVKAEMERRRKELANQGNHVIMKDVITYIDNIKELANDKSDKRVCLAANQYLLNRIYGNTIQLVQGDTKDNMEEVDTDLLSKELSKYKNLKAIK